MDINKTKTDKIVMTSIMTALIFVVTFFVKIPLGINGAYWNAGDVIIYMSAYILGGPLTALAAAAGSGLADLAGGSFLYILPTIIIKGLMGLIAGAIDKKQKVGYYLLGAIAGGALMAGGYTFYEFLLFGNGAVAVTLPFNLIQWFGGAGIAMLFYPAARTIASYYNFKKKITE